MVNEFRLGETIDFSNDTIYPCRAKLWCGNHVEAENGGTIFGFTTSPCVVENGNGATFQLAAKMYFSVPNTVKITGGAGVLIVRIGVCGLFTIGGPIEARGRLKYIDGCTDTVLINPPRRGDPVMSHLHFPPNIRQTMHSHPTVRIGIVVSGRGRAIHPRGESPLVPGVGWLLPVNGEHCFYTDDESLDIVAWHPDSDTGPNDDDHPMLNRTYVEGVSAAKIDAIRTR